MDPESRVAVFAAVLTVATLACIGCASARGAPVVRASSTAPATLRADLVEMGRLDEYIAGHAAFEKQILEQLKRSEAAAADAADAGSR